MENIKLENIQRKIENQVKHVSKDGNLGKSRHVTYEDKHMSFMTRFLEL